MSYKKRNLPHYLKYNNLEDFEIINNILVDRDSIKIGTRFKQFSNNPPKALRTKVSKTFKNYALKMNYERANLVIKCTSLQKHQKS